jgi:Fe-S-cluster containining protein
VTDARQQRRLQQREWSKQATVALQSGMPRVPPRGMVVGLARLLFSVFADTKTSKAGPKQAGRAVSLVHQVYEASLAQTPGKLEIACRRGCGFCCHTWVAATAPEIFLIAHHVRGAAAVPSGDWLSAAAIQDRAAGNTGLDIAARFGAKLPCVFLRDNACSIYAVRPTVCRQVTSTSLATCIEEFEGVGLGGDTVVSAVYLDHARNCRLPLMAALTAAGLPVAAYELSAGIARALETPDAETRWLAGEDVFAGVATAPADGTAYQRVIQEIAVDIV